MNEDACALCNEPVAIIEGSVAAPVYEGKLLSPEQEFQMGDELVCLPVHDRCLRIAQLEGALQRTYKLINHWSAEATREHQAAADLFNAIVEIAALVGVGHSEPEICRKTVAAVKQMVEEQILSREECPRCGSEYALIAECNFCSICGAKVIWSDSEESDR